MGDPGLELAHPEVAGWVLGTLDPDDAEWLAQHLPLAGVARTATEARRAVSSTA